MQDILNHKVQNWKRFCFTDFLGLQKGIPPSEQEKGYHLLKPIVTSLVEQGISIVAAKTILIVCKHQHIEINMTSVKFFQCNLLI